MYGVITDGCSQVAYNVTQFNKALRQVFLMAKAVTNAAALTSYSLRRFQPTCADVLEASMPHRYAIGGWRETFQHQASQRVGLQCMPVRYSGMRGESEETAKLQQWACLQQVVRTVTDQVITWEVFRSESPKLSCPILHARVATCMDGNIAWSPTASEADRRVIQARFCIPIRTRVGNLLDLVGVRAVSAAHRDRMRDVGCVTPPPSQDSVALSCSVLTEKTDMQITWASSGTKVHFLSGADVQSGTLCNRAGGHRAIFDLRFGGTSLTESTAAGLHYCQICLRAVPADQRSLVRDVLGWRM